MSRTTVAIPKIVKNINNVSGYGLGLTPDFIESIEVITHHYAEDKVITKEIIEKFLKEIECFNDELENKQ